MSGNEGRPEVGDYQSDVSLRGHLQSLPFSKTFYYRVSFTPEAAWWWAGYIKLALGVNRVVLDAP